MTVATGTDRVVAGRGFAVVVVDGSRAPATLAVWHLDITGAFTGAWLMERDAAYADAASARDVLGRFERRALAAWDPEDARRAVSELVELAELPAELAEAWARGTCRPADALAETREARARYERALEEEGKAKGKTFQPLRWEQPAELPTDDLDRALATAGLDSRLGVAEEAWPAIRVCRAIRYCLDVWAETESARSRRQALRDRFPTEQPLPPTWAGHVAESLTRVLPAPVG